MIYWVHLIIRPCLFLVQMVWILNVHFLLFRFKFHAFISLFLFYQIQLYVPYLRGRVQDCSKFLSPAYSSHRNLSTLLTNRLDLSRSSDWLSACWYFYAVYLFIWWSIGCVTSFIWQVDLEYNYYILVLQFFASSWY